MSNPFTMRNTSLTLAILAAVCLFTGLALFNTHDAQAQSGQEAESASTQAGFSPIQVSAFPSAQPTMVPVVPVSPSPVVTPEKVENIVLRWIMVFTAVLAAGSSLIVFGIAKLQEIRKALASVETNSNARFDRQDARAEIVRQKAEALDVKVEKHVTICDPLKNPEAHGARPSTPPQPPQT